jgi:hypothetical protein
MRYVYIIEQTTTGKESYIFKNFHAFSNFETCKTTLAEYMEKLCKSANDELWKDTELSVNAKFDFQSSYKWITDGKYYRKEYEEMKFSLRVTGYAEAKIELYRKYNNGYHKESYYFRIDRHRLL